MKNSQIKLTPRQTEIARLIMEGLTTDEIALKLNICRITAGDHRNRINKKLGKNKWNWFLYFTEDKSNLIIRTIEFPSEYCQAGISILSYFSTVLQQKHPDTNAKVSIEQNGLTVSMIIETCQGEKERIEKTLDDYGLVVQGRKHPELLLQDKYQLLELSQKLEIAKTELRLKHELLECKKSDSIRSEKRISNLEDQLSNLMNIVGTSLNRANTTIELLAGTQNELARYSISIINEKIEKGSPENDGEAVKLAIKNLRENDSNVYNQLVDIILKGAVSGAWGNYLTSWIAAVANSLPR